MSSGNGKAGTPSAAPDRDPIPEVEVQRTFSAETLNSVVNDPSVYPWVRGDAKGPLDLSQVIADPRNVLLEGEHGSMLFVPTGPGLWELHTQVLPEGRGAWTMGLATSALMYMYTHTDAVEILTRVPKGNLAAASAAKRFGFTPQWEQNDGWAYEGEVVGITVYSLTLQAWLAGAWCATLEDAANAFADAIGTLDDSDEDDEPLRADALRPLGFALGAISGGQAAKGCAFLNRWGSIAGFPPAFVAADHPLVVALGGAMFRVNEHGQLVDITTVH